jgi:HEPN domain-containing protein
VRELTVTRHLSTPVNFIVHSLMDVNDQLARGRPFFADIARDGIASTKRRDRASPCRASSTRRNATPGLRHRDHWFPLARAKLAQDSIADGVPRDAAFMLHQAVERAYNAVLLVLTLYAPKSHRLGILRSLAENLDPRLIEAWPRDTRAARRHFAQLQRAYVEARYSHAYEITPDELAWLVERVSISTIAAAICAELSRHDRHQKRPRRIAMKPALFLTPLLGLAACTPAAPDPRGVDRDETG